MRRDTPQRSLDVLLVEDNPGDVRLTEEAFKESRLTNELHVVTDGESALDFLYQRNGYVDAPRPGIVLLDLGLPGMSGEDVLEEIKVEGPTELRVIPVIVLTGSKAGEDVVRSYDVHANAYMQKPVDADEFIDVARTIADFWIELVKLPSDELSASNRSPAE